MDTDIVGALLTQILKLEQQKAANDLEATVELTTGDAKDRTVIKCRVSELPKILYEVAKAKHEAAMKTPSQPPIIGLEVAPTQAQGSR